MIRKYSKVVIALLLLIECLFTFLSIKSFSNKGITKMNELNEVNKEMFSMYIEQEDGSYIEYTDSNSFAIDGYTLDLEKSSCIDNKGNIVSNVLSKSDDKVTISSNKTSYCYLYFSLLTAPGTILEGKENISYELEAGMYRYQGSSSAVTNNYVCFGTSNTTTCTGNTDAYMYRIIGITESGQMKLIKKEALNTLVKWWSDFTTDVAWPSSLIYTTLNGNDFLLNETYVPSGWESKIATHSWKYGDTTSNGSYKGATIYATENAWTNTVSAKIGLMYIHDYYYAYASGGTPGSYSNAKTAWIHLSANDSGEWTMSRYGLNGSRYRAWGMYSSGIVNNGTDVTYSYLVRPVFYLTSDVDIIGGTGTSTDPFIIG